MPEENIYQKLAKIRNHVEVMKKEAKGYGYTYTKEEAILTKVTALMKKYDISLLPGIKPGTLTVQPYITKKTKVSGKGDVYEENVNDVLVSADTTWTWVNNLNPEERIEIPWALVGQQSDASQSFGSGLTYSSRYFLLKYFNVSTTNDDPDNLRSQQKQTEAEEDAIIAKSLVAEINNAVTSYINSDPKKGEEVKKFMSKYVKDSNYFAIKEPVLAAKVLEDFNNNFNKGE